jgi:hypothetical protein
MTCSSCGSADYRILSRHPSGNWVIECVFCHYRWLDQPNLEVNR